MLRAFVKADLAATRAALDLMQAQASGKEDPKARAKFVKAAERQLELIQRAQRELSTSAKGPGWSTR